MNIMKFIVFTISVLSLTFVSLSSLSSPIENDGIDKKRAPHKVAIGGFLQWDYDYFKGLHNNDETGSEMALRRARLIFKGKLPDNFSYVLMPNYNNAKKEVSLLNAFIRYKGFSSFDVTVGRFKDPFGLEALTKAIWLSSIERSVILNRPNPIRAGLFIDSGIMLSKAYQNTTWALAVVNDGTENEHGKDMLGITGRLTHAITSNNGSLLHLGAAQAYRNADRGTRFTLSEPLGVSSAKKLLLVDTTISDFSQTGLELAYCLSGFSAQSEYIFSKIKGDASGEDIDIASYYGQLTYTLGREARAYKKGIFGAVKPLKGKKATELVIRYEDNDFKPSIKDSYSATTATVGVNAYINQNIKMSFYYINSKTKNIFDISSGNAVSARMQLRF